MMAERGFRLGNWQMFAVISVLAVVVIILLIRTAAPPGPEAGSGQLRPGAPRNAVDSVAYLDSLEAAAGKNVLRETMSLAEVAARAEIPLESLVAELRLPATNSRIDALRSFLGQQHLTLKDVHDARRRLAVRLGKAANLK